MKFVGEAIPNGYAGVFGKLFDDFLPMPAVFDAVVHASEDARRIGDALFFADLRGGRIEIGRIHAEIMRCDLEAASCARAGLLEDESDVFALAELMRHAGFLLRFQLCGKIEKFRDFLGREIEQL